MIIDTPPAIAENIRSVVAAADLVLIPTRPSAHDLRVVGATVALVEAARRPMVGRQPVTTRKVKSQADASLSDSFVLSTIRMALLVQSLNPPPFFA